MLTQDEVLNLDLNTIKWVHFVGLLSPFSSFGASKLIQMGRKVTASEYDLTNPQRETWEKQGVLYPGGHDKEYIKDGIGLVIYPNGPIPGNPECEESERRGGGKPRSQRSRP